MPRSHIAIIGAPLDLGQGRRGVDMGPSALRVANLNARLASLGYVVEDLGNVPVEQAEAAPEGHPARQVPAADRRHLPTPGAARRRRPSRGGGVPLVLGGDHSVAVGTVSGVSHYLPRTRAEPSA